MKYEIIIIAFLFVLKGHSSYLVLYFHKIRGPEIDAAESDILTFSFKKLYPTLAIMQLNMIFATLPLPSKTPHFSKSMPQFAMQGFCRKVLKPTARYLGDVFKFQNHNGNKCSK